MPLTQCISGITSSRKHLLRGDKSQSMPCRWLLANPAHRKRFSTHIAPAPQSNYARDESKLQLSQHSHEDYASKQSKRKLTIVVCFGESHEIPSLPDRAWPRVAHTLSGEATKICTEHFTKHDKNLGNLCTAPATPSLPSSLSPSPFPSPL